MNHRTEIDIALLGYAIQIEREAQHKKTSEFDKQMSRFRRYQKFGSEVLLGNIELVGFKTKK